jgi:hypothetical protein
MAKFENARQIAKYQTGKALVEFNDRLSLAEAENASTLHSNYSKIHVVGIDYAKGKGPSAVVADLNIDPDTAKTLAAMILSFVPTDDIVTVLREEKILSFRKNDAGESKVTKFTVGYNPKMNLPWNITVENGMGIPQVNSNTGGTAIKSGSYRQEKLVKLVLNDFSMKRLMIQVSDYIKAFEISHFQEMLAKRAAYEQEQMESRN